MEFDWKSIAGAVAPIAPKLGAVLGAAFGGPIGSAIGGIAGRAIAGAFGVEATPEAVGKAIASDPEAVKKLQILEATEGERIRAAAQIEIERIKSQTEQSKAINETIRAENASGVSWWHWRHLIGYATLGYGSVFAAGTAKIMFFGGNIAEFSQLVTASVPIVAILAAFNGYVAADTTNRMNTAITGEHSAGGVMNTLRTILVKK